MGEREGQNARTYPDMVAYAARITASTDGRVKIQPCSAASRANLVHPYFSPLHACCARQRKDGETFLVFLSSFLLVRAIYVQLLVSRKCILHLAEVDVLAVGKLEGQRKGINVCVDVDLLPRTQSEARRGQIGDIGVVELEGNRNLCDIALVHVCVGKEGNHRDGTVWVRETSRFGLLGRR